MTAIKLLAQGLNQAEVAKTLGVHRRTVARWLLLAEFAEAITKIQSQTVKIVTDQTAGVTANHLSRIEGLIGKGLDAVEQILDDPESRPDHKLKAAHLLLSRIPVVQPSRMSELEAIQILVDAGAVPVETLQVIREGITSFRQTALGAFRSAALESKVVEFRQRDR